MRPVNVLNEWRKIFLRIYDSGCLCGSYDPDRMEAWIEREKNRFGHSEDCHKVIVARVLGYKVTKR